PSLAGGRPRTAQGRLRVLSWRPRRLDRGGPRVGVPLCAVPEPVRALPLDRTEDGRSVKFRAEDLAVVAEDAGNEIGRAELRIEGLAAWVEHLYASRPGVEEPLLREA